MGLINAHTFTLGEFVDENAVNYAILSHRWQTEEVSLQAFKETYKVASRMRGYRKIVLSCKQAIADGYSYLWCNTCCIDKTSSAELSEAINSMYLYYQAAAECYVYLEDIEADADDVLKTEAAIKASQWFTRGWTLQELLALRRVVFYDMHWSFLSTQETLCSLLSMCTAIDERILFDEEPVTNRSIAQRMSWASRRSTQRREDLAYCLLGISMLTCPCYTCLLYTSPSPRDS